MSPQILLKLISEGSLTVVGTIGISALHVACCPQLIVQKSSSSSRTSQTQFKNQPGKCNSSFLLFTKLHPLNFTTRISWIRLKNWNLCDSFGRKLRFRSQAWRPVGSSYPKLASPIVFARWSKYIDRGHFILFFFRLCLLPSVPLLLFPSQLIRDNSVL